MTMKTQYDLYYNYVEFCNIKIYNSWHQHDIDGNYEFKTYAPMLVCAYDDIKNRKCILSNDQYIMF